MDDFGLVRKRVRLLLSEFVCEALVEKLALYVRRKRDRAVTALARMKDEAAK